MEKTARVAPEATSNLVDGEKGVYSQTVKLSGNEVRAVPLEDRPSHLGTIGPYELVDELARGGMGIVYKARHTQLQRTVALKVTRDIYQLSAAETHDRFQVEIAAAAKLDHPNIVTLFEVGEDCGRHYLSMAYIDGENLGTMTQEGPLAPLRAAKILAKVANAVSYAHERGIIHRDLKPDNIMLDKSGQPHVTDFGLAKLIDIDQRLTQPGDVIGTPSFMSPEQIKSLQLAGPSSDIYSLGATLYCLLTGRPPFQSATPVDTVNQVIENDPVPLRQLNPMVPRDLETICLKCLEKKPERRYASAHALEKDLNRFLLGKSIHARRISPVEKCVRWCRRNPLVGGLIASLLIIFFTAFFLVYNSYLNANEAKKEAEANGEAERWERYRSQMAAESSALQLNNQDTARQILEEAPLKYRGWEWFYFKAQLDGAESVLDMGKEDHHTPLFVVNPVRPELAIATFSGDVYWFDFDDSDKRKPIGSHDEEVLRMSFSSDGNLLATCTRKGEVFVWDAKSKSPHRIFNGLLGHVNELRWSEDSSQLLARCDNFHLRVWHFEEKQENDPGNLTSKIAKELKDFVISHVRQLRHFTFAEPMQPLFVQDHPAEIGQIAINPVSKDVAVGVIYPDNNVHVWDLATGSKKFTLKGHTNGVNWVRYSPDGELLVSASKDQSLRLWNAQTGALLAILNGHTGPVHQADFSPDGRLIASSSEDGTSRLWDAKKGTRIGVLRGHTDVVYDVQFTHDSKRVITRSVDLSLRIWDLESYEALSTRKHDSYVYDVCFGNNGNWILSCGWDGKLKIWDARSQKILRTLDHDVPIVSCVAINANGTRIATFGRFVEDKKGRVLTMWNALNGEKLFVVRLPDSNFLDARLAFHPSEDLVALGHIYGEVFFYDCSTGELRKTLNTNHGQILDVDFHPSGNTLVTASTDGKVHVIDPDNGTSIATLTGHKDLIFRVRHNKGGTLIASASKDQTVRVWDAVSHELKAVLPHGCLVYGVAFSPDGKRLATGCSDNTIRLWDIATFQQVAELRGHDSYVHALDFSPDGTRLVSGSGDNAIRIWDSILPQERAKMNKSEK